AHMMISGLGLLAARPEVAGRRSWVPPMIMSCCYAVVLTIYPSVVHLGAQAIALGHVCLLSGLFVLLPWPWQAQCGVSVTVLAALGAAIAHLHSGEGAGCAIVGVVTGAVTSVTGTFYLDRYRLEGFLREAELAHASAEKQEEAEVAATLLEVTSTLSARAGEPDLLSHLVRVATAAVGSDWGAGFVWDDQRRVFHLGGGSGGAPGIGEHE